MSYDSPASQLTQRTVDTSKRLAGDLAIWFFIFAELSVFAIFFIAYSWMKSRNPELFISGQQTLHPQAGLINTVALITSSFIVALAVIAAKCQRWQLARWGLISAILVAGIYIFTKLWEYDQLWSQGYDLSTNNFYMFYFFTTGFHFLHVVLGMVILAILALIIGKRAQLPSGKNQAQAEAEEQLSGLESGASYWHMVDLVWIILFPLIYII